MNTLDRTTHTRPVDDQRMGRIEALLRRYPGLTDDEMGEVLLFLRKGPALEVGLLTGNEELRPQLDRFRAENAKALSIGGKELAIIAILIVVVIALIALLWDAGGGR